MRSYQAAHNASVPFTFKPVCTYRRPERRQKRTRCDCEQRVKSQGGSVECYIATGTTISTMEPRFASLMPPTAAAPMEASPLRMVSFIRFDTKVYTGKPSTSAICTAVTNGKRLGAPFSMNCWMYAAFFPTVKESFRMDTPFSLQVVFTRFRVSSGVNSSTPLRTLRRGIPLSRWSASLVSSISVVWLVQ